MAAVLFCSRSSVYRTVRSYREGSLAWEYDDDGPLVPPGRRTMSFTTLRRSLVARLKAPPRAYGWGRTRWSCATLAWTWQATRGITVSAETRRRWIHAVDWVWKRPTLVAKDDDPRRVERLARIRVTFEPLKRSEAMVAADALDIHLWPKVGYAWMPQGMHMTVMTPGTHEKRDLAGALDLATGARLHGVAARQTDALVRDLLTRLDACSPAERYTRL
jgi:transposase